MNLRTPHVMMKGNPDGKYIVTLKCIVEMIPTMRWIDPNLYIYSLYIYMFSRYVLDYMYFQHSTA